MKCSHGQSELLYTCESIFWNEKIDCDNQKNVCFFPIFWCWLFRFWWSSRRSFFAAQRICHIPNCITPLKISDILKNSGKNRRKSIAAALYRSHVECRLSLQGVGHVFWGKCFKYFLFVLFDLIRSWCFTGKLYKTIRDMLFEEIKPKILFLKNAFPE